MSEDTRTKQAESEETQQPPLSSGDQKTAEPAEPAEVSPRGEDQTEAAGDEAKLPDGVKERTSEQFEKLKTQLAEERTQRTKLEQMFGQSSPQPANKVPDYYDPETGTVDVGKLEAHNANLKNEIEGLKGQVQGIAQSEQVKQEQETYQSYPDLDPVSTKFNQPFHDAVSGLLTNSLLKGEQISFKQAADRISGLSDGALKKAEKAGVEKAIESLTPKEQAALEATGRSDRGQQQEKTETLENLRQGTRHGDVDSIVERMKRASSS